MTPKDLPELPEFDGYFVATTAAFTKSRAAAERVHCNLGPDASLIPVRSVDQVLAIQREAYELGARSTAAQPADFEPWLRTVCFQKPTPEAYDLARDAWIASRAAAQPVEPPVTPTEAVVGFASWVTCRPGTLPAGEGHDAAPWSEAVHEFVVAQGWPTVRDVFPHNLKRPPLSAPPAASGDSTPPSEPAVWPGAAQTWKWMTHPHWNEGFPIPVLLTTDPDSGEVWYQPFSTSCTDFEWACRDKEWAEVAAPVQGDPSGALRPEPEAVGQDLIDAHADALRFRWLCQNPDWHFIEHLCREFVAGSSIEFLTELRRVIDARRSVDLGPFEQHMPAASQQADREDE